MDGIADCDRFQRMKQALLRLLKIDHGPIVDRESANRWADRIELWLVCLTVGLLLVGGLAAQAAFSTELSASVQSCPAG